MITCEQCKGWPVTYFVEMIGGFSRRTLCPTCTALVATRYVARAKRRAERRKEADQRPWATRRKNAQEEAQ